MFREIFIIGMLMVAVMSVVFISGCIQTEKPASGEMVGEDVYNAIENELEEAVENITLEDIENALLE
ncbi:MAG: hypothetical protein DRP15_00875 [Candidatus Aenigmatarchaeota archaeon]|nr:MAG: hypothetical protein DRP15_00875 [Candidatus Aenigmarchaeota archaeon]